MEKLRTHSVGKVQVNLLYPLDLPFQPWMKPTSNISLTRVHYDYLVQTQVVLDYVCIIILHNYQLLLLSSIWPRVLHITLATAPPPC